MNIQENHGVNHTTLFKDRFQGLMDKKKWTHKETAEKIEVATGKSIAKNTIDAYCKSNTPIPNLDKLCAIAETFGVDVGYLLGEYEPQNISKATISELTKLNECSAHQLDRARVRTQTREVLDGILSDQNFPLLVDAIYKFIHSHNDDINSPYIADMDILKRIAVAKYETTDLFNRILENLYQKNCGQEHKKRFYHYADDMFCDISREIDKYRLARNYADSKQLMISNEFLEEQKEMILNWIQRHLDYLRGFQVRSCIFQYTPLYIFENLDTLKQEYEKEKNQ